MEGQNKRSSILKRPVTEESSPTFTRSTRRISFSGKKNVKEFMPGDGGATIWITSYEESAEIMSTKSAKGNLYGGLQATPEAIMRLRNNKVISKIPQKAGDKAKNCKGVKNVPREKKSHDDREQLSRNFQKSFDISLNANEMQRLKINRGEERLPLRPLKQHPEYIEASEMYISSQTSLKQHPEHIEVSGMYISPQNSLNCPSPASIYCSFALTKKEIGKLHNNKQIDLTLEDILTESGKMALHGNNQISNLRAADMLNEMNISSVQGMGNTCKAKRETMFTLENMELVSSKKSPNKRSTTYYFDNLELSIKSNQNQHVSLSKLSKLNMSNELQEKDDCDKENRNDCVSIIDPINFKPQKNADRRDSTTNDLHNVKNNFQIECGAKQFAFSKHANMPIEDEVNKENRGYIDMENIMDLSETENNTNPLKLQHGHGKNEDIAISEQNMNRLENQLAVSLNYEQHLTSEEERNLDRMDMSLSPGTNSCSMNLSVLIEEPSRNRQTICSSYGLNLTLQNEREASNKETNLVECTKLNEMKEVQENEGMDIMRSSITDDRDLNSHLPGNTSNDNMHNKGRRTIYIPCNVDLSLQKDTLEQVGNDEDKVQQEGSISRTKKRRTVLTTCDLDLTLQNEVQSTSEEIVTDNKLEEVLSSDSVAMKCVEERHFVRNTCDFDLENESMILNKSIENKPEEILQRHSTINIRTTKKRLTAYNTCDLDFTLENEDQMVVDNISEEINQNPSEDNIKIAEKRRTMSNTCDLDFTLQDNLEFPHGEIVNNKREEILESPSKMVSYTSIQPRFIGEKIRKPQLEESRLKDVHYSKQDTENISEDKDRSLHFHCDIDFTQKPHGEIVGSVRKNSDSAEQNIPQTTNKIEKAGCTVKRKTAYSPFNLDYMLEDVTQISGTTPMDSKITEFKVDKNFSVAMQQEIPQKTSAHKKTNFELDRRTTYALDLDLTLQKETENFYSIPSDSNIKNDVSKKISNITMEDGIQNVIGEHAESKIKRQTVHTALDSDFIMEEDEVRNIAKARNLKLSKNGGRCVSPKVPQNRCSDIEFLNWSPISTSFGLADKSMSKGNVKENVIFAAKCQTIYDSFDLDISLQCEPICSNVTKNVVSDNRLPDDCMVLVTDTNSMKCNSKNNAGNNMSSLKKRQTIYSPVNVDLTIQNDLTDNKIDAESSPEMSNKEIFDMGSKKHNIHHSVALIHPTKAAYKDGENDKKEQHLNSGEQNEILSCFSMKTKETDGASKREYYNAQKHDTLHPKLHKLQRSENKKKNNLNESISKNCNTEGNVRPSLQNGEANNSLIQIVESAIEGSVLTNEPANRTELNSKNFKFTGYNMGSNSLKNIDFSEQLENTSIIFSDPSQETDLEIIDIRDAQNVETPLYIPRFGRSSRASSCQTNVSCNFSAVNTTEALCNIDFDKITANLKTTPSFVNATNNNKFSDTLRDNSYQCIPSPFKTDDIEKINLSVSNLNLNSASKDVNLKKDIPANKFKSQRALTVKYANEGQQSFCSRCKECDCKPAPEQNESDVSAFCRKIETPSAPRGVDFSRYEKFQNLPTIRELLDSHRRRRESINFESYEESVCNPIVPSLDDLLENYTKQFKLKVEKELPVGAIYPLIPTLDILINNKLQSEQFGWRLNTLCIPSGVMEFCNDKIRSATLIFRYSPNSFYSNEEKVMFEKVWLKISKLYGNSSPLDKIIESEIFLKTPYDLINYCPCLNDLFSFLSFMNNICEQAMQIGREFYKTVVHLNGSVEKDNSDVCFIKKTARYTPNKKNVFLITQDFLVRVKNIGTISYTDILLPPLSDLKESISSLPEGLEFLMKFFSDPVSYLKAKS